MDFQIRVMKPEERLYPYKQSQQIQGQCGGIGYLHADFGKGGNEFYSSWDDFSAHLKTEEFKAEFDEVINTLRFSEAGGGLFKDRASMLAYCRAQPDSAFMENYCVEYGFRVDTAKHAYLIRCNPTQGDYNLYVFPYVRAWLDHHIEKASNGVRFIDSGYKELFRIPDGGKITITYADGETNTRACRFIDEYHMEIDNNLYHICEFAEKMERMPRSRGKPLVRHYQPKKKREKVIRRSRSRKAVNGEAMQKKYDCKHCCYRRKDVNFCAFCMKRILDEMARGKQSLETVADPPSTPEINEESEESKVKSG